MEYELGGDRAVIIVSALVAKSSGNAEGDPEMFFRGLQ